MRIGMSRVSVCCGGTRYQGIDFCYLPVADVGCVLGRVVVAEQHFLYIN